MAIAEAWFCAQWPIFVLFLRFEFGLLYGWKIQTLPIIRFLTESVTFYFLSVSFRYNPWCHVSKQDVQDLQQKYRPTTSKIEHNISLYTWGTFYPYVHQTHLECWAAIKRKFLLHLTIKPVPFEVPVVSDNWICWSLFLDELGKFFLKPSQITCRYFFYVFWPRD